MGLGSSGLCGRLGFRCRSLPGSRLGRCCLCDGRFDWLGCRCLCRGSLLAAAAGFAAEAAGADAAAALAKFGCTTLPPWVRTVALTSSSSKSILIVLAILVDQGLDEGEEVLGVKLRGGRGNAAGDIQVADDLDAVHFGNLAGNRAFDIAAALHRQIDEDRARTHARIHLARHQPWRGAPRNERRGDDDILLGDMVGNQGRLLGLIFLRHFLGVTTRRLGCLEFLVLDREELGAERGDLFLDRRTHIGCRHHRTKPARRGNRLQPGNTDAHDEHFGGRHGAGRRHHHRQARGHIPHAASITA